jgi:hypothetical protein
MPKVTMVERSPPAAFDAGEVICETLRICGVSHLSRAANKQPEEERKANQGRHDREDTRVNGLVKFESQAADREIDDS